MLIGIDKALRNDKDVEGITKNHWKAKGPEDDRRSFQNLVKTKALIKATRKTILETVKGRT